MARFSERIGAVKPPKGLQINGMGDALRNSLWNILYLLYQVSDDDYWRDVARFIAHGFRKVPADEIPYQDSACREWLKKYFFSLTWYQVYDLIEFIIDNHSRMVEHHALNRDECITYTNKVLERELSGYRFVSGVLSPITDATEADAISTAIEQATKSGLVGAREHLRTALVQLGKKPDPDYRNSVKESISAVESVVKQISGSKSKGLDVALEELNKVAGIHGSLKSGFKSLYGYSSDEHGIRHALLEQSNVGFPEAKYMLVACSAFVHYLIQKADDAKLL